MNNPDYRILIVDDETENLDLMEYHFAASSYQLSFASNGMEALELARKIKPDIILLDVVMPEMDGYETCQQLKLEKDTRDIPVIFITSKGEMENESKGLELGAIDYILKPISPSIVKARVKNHLELKKTRDSLKESIREKEEFNLMLQAIFSSVPDGIITVDENLRILESNKKQEEFCCISKTDSISIFQKRAGNGESPCHEVILQTLKTRKPVREYQAKCNCEKHGSKTLVLNATPLNDPENKFLGAVLVMRDISRLVQLEKEVYERHSFKNIIGKSEGMQKIFSLLEQTADLEMNALITGESGAGKEVVANAIHYSGNRSKGPLIKVNCAALSENLLESELFGHVRGAFTGAIQDRTGRIQLAEGGTLFLDEIGDISHRMQLRLLRFLESKEYDRVGDSKTMKADVRVVAATNCDLKEKIRIGEFREDLYYRLMRITIQLPPLKERIEDIPLLCNHFIKLFRESNNKNLAGISDGVMKLFMRYSWRGNVRELKNTLEYACAICKSELIQEEHLPPYFISALQTDQPNVGISALTDGSEEGAIIAALNQTDGNKAKAARILGISRGTLYNKLLKYRIEKIWQKNSY
jgi:PAS domain S-box-containing protein